MIFSRRFIFAILLFTILLIEVFLYGRNLILTDERIRSPVVSRDDAAMTFDVALELQRILEGNADPLDGIRTELDAVIDEGGISGALQLVREGFRTEDLGIYQCHILVHILGHEAYEYYNGDFSAIVQHVDNFCLRGYQHGAEAQIIANGTPDFREELLRFCLTVQGHEPGASCYHGAGHGALRQTFNIEKALQLCLSLLPYPGGDMSDCYRGVFSEFTNDINGIDGETGLRFSGEPPMHLDRLPLDFCASLAESYQIPCAFELSGHMMTVANGDGEAALRGCLESGPPGQLRVECLRSVSAVIAQQELSSRKDAVTVRPFIFDLSDPFRQAYIRGAMVEFSSARVSGSDKDWVSFCSAFPKSDDRAYCASFLDEPTPELQLIDPTA